MTTSVCGYNGLALFLHGFIELYRSINCKERELACSIVIMDRCMDDML